MATIVEMINPLTGLPEQVDKLDHTAQEIDDAVDLAPQLSNPNLLDNWYFAYPVNQRNVSGTIDAVGYFLDRWKLVSGSVTIGSNGITLNGTIAQILETAVGTDVTASALTTEGVVVASYDNNSKTISLTGTGQTFVAAKLELCSTQTLAHQDANGNWVLNEIPDYGEQLARCQRYLRPLPFRADAAFPGFITSVGNAEFTLPFGNMYKQPSVVGLDPTKLLIALVSGGTYTSPTSDTVIITRNDNGYIALHLSKIGGDLPIRTPASLIFNLGSSRAYLTCEL